VVEKTRTSGIKGFARCCLGTELVFEVTAHDLDFSSARKAICARLRVSFRGLTHGADGPRGLATDGDPQGESNPMRTAKSSGTHIAPPALNYWTSGWQWHSGRS
jgi:hypothetical protein